MAMDKDTLGALIKAKIDLLSATEKQTDIKVWTAVAEAIISHIKTNADVKIGIALSASGIVTSPGASMTSTGATTAKGQIE